ncbi:MAG: hypothetical protein QXI89_00845 [Candidatus Anstonellales archaeon]
MDKEKLDKLVALTFDEDPKIRKKALRELAKVNDAAALIAIAELAYDKDKSVQEEAKRILEERKKTLPHKQLPLNELFEGVSFSGGQESKKKDEEKAEKQASEPRIIEPIKNIFLQKYKDEKKATKALEQFISNIKREKEPTAQNVLTAYIETRAFESKEDTNNVIKELIEEKAGEKNKEGIDIEVIGHDVKTENIQKEAQEVEDDYLFKEEKKMIEDLSAYPPTPFKIAYDELMALNGDEKLMKKQADMLVNVFKKQVELAYKIVKKRFKQIKLTDISEIKDGMKGITTDLLEVIEVKHLSYKDGKKEKLFTRVMLRDANGKEGILYLFDGRGQFLKPGMKISLEKAKAKTFKFSNETALTLDKRGRAYIHI